MPASDWRNICSFKKKKRKKNWYKGLGWLQIIKRVDMSSSAEKRNSLALSTSLKPENRNPRLFLAPFISLRTDPADNNICLPRPQFIITAHS